MADAFGSIIDEDASLSEAGVLLQNGHKVALWGT